MSSSHQSEVRKIERTVKKMLKVKDILVKSLISLISSHNVC